MTERLSVALTTKCRRRLIVMTSSDWLAQRLWRRHIGRLYGTACYQRVNNPPFSVMFCTVIWSVRAMITLCKCIDITRL